MNAEKGLRNDVFLDEKNRSKDIKDELNKRVKFLD